MSNKELEHNILDKELIRIDFMKIINLEDRIFEVIPYLKKYGYELDENIQDDNNVEKIKDPDPLITQDIMEKTKDNRINYIFKKEDEKFVINEYLITFEKYDFKDYNTIEKYLNYLNDILEILIKDENLNYQRIGIRKSNRLIIKEGYEFNKIFRKISNNQIEDNEKNVIIGNEKNVTSEDISYNINSTIRSGIARLRDEKKESINEYRAYMINLDLDYYSRNLDGYDNKNIIKKLRQINDELYETFKSQITEEFLNKLKKSESDFSEYGIIGGINAN